MRLGVRARLHPYILLLYLGQRKLRLIYTAKLVTELHLRQCNYSNSDGKSLGLKLAFKQAINPMKLMFLANYTT
jgi:hypothetical protein